MLPRLFIQIQGTIEKQENKDYKREQKLSENSTPKRCIKKNTEEVADSSTSSNGLFFRTDRHQKQMRNLKLQQIAKVSHH